LASARGGLFDARFGKALRKVRFGRVSFLGLDNCFGHKDSLEKQKPALGGFGLAEKHSALFAGGLTAAGLIYVRLGGDRLRLLAKLQQFLEFCYAAARLGGDFWGKVAVVLRALLGEALFVSGPSASATPRSCARCR
jgi:hypothetical protein